MAKGRKKEKAKERLDRAFDYLLLLVTIITAMEYQHITTLPEQAQGAGGQFFLKIFTAPLIIVIGLWLIKYFVEDEKWNRRLSELCWDLLGVLLIAYIFVLSSVFSPWWTFTLVYLSAIVIVCSWSALAEIDEVKFLSRISFRWHMYRFGYLFACLLLAVAIFFLLQIK